MIISLIPETAARRLRSPGPLRHGTHPESGYPRVTPKAKCHMRGKWRRKRIASLSITHHDGSAWCLDSAHRIFRLDAGAHLLELAVQPVALLHTKYTAGLCAGRGEADRVIATAQRQCAVCGAVGPRCCLSGTRNPRAKQMTFPASAPTNPPAARSRPVMARWSSISYRTSIGAYLALPDWPGIRIAI